MVDKERHTVGHEPSCQSASLKTMRSPCARFRVSDNFPPHTYLPPWRIVNRHGEKQAAAGEPRNWQLFSNEKVGYQLRRHLVGVNK